MFRGRTLAQTSGYGARDLVVPQFLVFGMPPFLALPRRASDEADHDHRCKGTGCQSGS